MSKSKSKAKVYIDGANIFYTQRRLGWNLDWQKVKDYLNKKWDIVEHRYYVGLKQGDDAIRKYLKYLDYINFNVLTKPLKIIQAPLSVSTSGQSNLECTPRIINQIIYKCNFDVEISTDICFDRTKIDEIILFSGDSDFRYLVEKMKSVGKRVIVFSSRKTISWELKLSASKYIFIEDLKQELGRYK